MVGDENSECDDCGNAEHKENEYGDQCHPQPTEHGAQVRHIQGKDVRGFFADF